MNERIRYLTIALQLLRKLGALLKMPRITAKQQHRSNAQATTPHEY